MDSVQYILIILYRKLSQKCTYGNFYHCFLHHLIHLLYLVKGRLTLAGYSGFNVNILITFQAVKDLYALPTCLRFRLFCKYIAQNAATHPGTFMCAGAKIQNRLEKSADNNRE